MGYPYRMQLLFLVALTITALHMAFWLCLGLSSWQFIVSWIAEVDWSSGCGVSCWFSFGLTDGRLYALVEATVSSAKEDGRRVLHVDEIRFTTHAAWVGCFANRCWMADAAALLDPAPRAGLEVAYPRLSLLGVVDMHELDLHPAGKSNLSGIPPLFEINVRSSWRADLVVTCNKCNQKSVGVPSAASHSIGLPIHDSYNFRIVSRVICICGGLGGWH